MRLSSPLLLLLLACTSEQRGLALTTLDGSGLRATVHLHEGTGKSLGKVVSAAVEVSDPQGRALVAALHQGRCTAVGDAVERIQLGTATGHLRTVERLAALETTHVVVIHEEKTFDDRSAGTPLACVDL